MAGEEREQSVQFSLHELRKLEDERLDREKREREAAEAAAKAATEQAARREREAMQRIEAEARERERRSRVEDEARREAMSRAAVEQARISIEARARAEEAERERQHELAIAKLRREVARPHGLGMLLGSGAIGGALAIAACFTFYFASVRPGNAQLVDGLEGAAARAEARAHELSREGLVMSRRIADLEAQLRAAETRQQPPAKGVEATNGPQIGKGPAPTGPRASSKPDPCDGNADPLCGLDLRPKK